MSWDTDLVQHVSFTVKVSGVERPHEELSWAQDITSDLPAAVTAGGQVGIRTGEIAWAREQLVETVAPSPWYRGSYWIPETGEPVTIDAHDGKGNVVRVFTGVIDTVEGTAYGARSSKIVAEVERHDKVVRYGSLTRYGSPVAAPTGNGQIRRQATTPVWLINEIIRDLGYHAIPPAPADDKIILDAPLQGGTYIYFQSTPNGETVVSHRPGHETLAPTWSWGPDGFGIADAFLEWVPRTGGGTGYAALGMSFLIYSAHAGQASVTVSHGDEVVKVAVTADRQVQISTIVGGTWSIRTLSSLVPEGDGPHRVSLVFRYDAVNAQVNGISEQLPCPTPSTAVTRIKLEADATSCIAGLQVWHPSSITDHHAPGWEPTARFRYGTGTHSTVLTPSVRDRKARDVLEDYASALLSPLWIDGDGVLQIVTGKALHSQAPTLTVDALRDVSELSYSLSSLDHRPTVEVTYEHAHHANATATEARTVVWQGRGVAVDPYAPDETFVEVPDDEEWIMLADPALARQFTWSESDSAAFYTRVGSWWGFRNEDTAGNNFMSTAVTQNVEALTPWVWKVTSSTTDSNGVESRTPKQYSEIPASLRDMELPIYRARSRVRYEPRTVSVTAGDDPYKGVLTHDTGKWVTTTSAASDLCGWVHSMVSQPTPVLENLVLRFNPEVDVSKKVTVKAKAVFGADFEALVLSAEHHPYQGTTTITARVTKVTTFAATLDEVDYAHVGQSLAQWESNRTGMTLDAVTADPYLT